MLSVCMTPIFSLPVSFLVWFHCAFVRVCFVLYSCFKFKLIFHFLAMPHGMWDLSSPIKARICTPSSGGLSMGLHRVGHDWSDLAAAAAVEAWSLSHWTAREVLVLCFRFESSIIWNWSPRHFSAVSLLASNPSIQLSFWWTTWNSDIQDSQDFVLKIQVCLFIPSANWKTNKHTQFNFLSKTNITNYFSGPNFYCLEGQGITSGIWANKDKVSFSWQSCFYRKLIQSEFLQQSHLTIPELHKTAGPRLYQLVVSWTLQAIWYSGRQSLQLEFGRRTRVCHLPFCAILS